MSEAAIASLTRNLNHRAEKVEALLADIAERLEGIGDRLDTLNLFIKNQSKPNEPSPLLRGH